MKTISRKRLLGVVLSIVLLFCIAVPTVWAQDGTTRSGFPTVNRDNPDILLTVQYHQTEARTALKLINDFRLGDEAYYVDRDNSTLIKVPGLKAYTYSYGLEEIAMQRVVEYAAWETRNVKADKENPHIRPNGEEAGSAVLENGAELYGENLGYGMNIRKTAAESINSWKEDGLPYSKQGHRRLLLNSDLTHIGVAYITYEGQEFWAMAAGYADSSAETPAEDSSKKVYIEVERRFKDMGESEDTPVELPDIPVERVVKDSGYCGSESRSDIAWTLYDDGELILQGKGAMLANTEDGEYSPWLHNKSIKKITIGEGIQSISYYAFRGCENLAEVNFPSSLLFVGQYAFEGCSKLSNLELPGSLKRIGEAAFRKIGIEELVLPDGLETVEDQAFALNESLKVVHVPMSVTAIKGGAFSSCDGIIDVYYAGSPSEWEAIEGDSQSASLWAAPNIHYGKEDPTTTTTTAAPTSTTTTTSSTTKKTTTTSTKKPTTTSTTKAATTNSTKTSDESSSGVVRQETAEDAAPLNGLVKGPDGKWAVYKNGKVDTMVTSIVKNDYGWWRVEKGYVNFNANGIYKNEYGWWKTKDGKVTFDETGVFKNDYGWWRVEKSKANFKADGIYKNQYGWWKTTNGKVTFKENGVFKNEYGWWKVKNSKVDFKFTGIASNQYGSWYIKNGKVDFSKNGKVQYNGKTYTVKGGKVQ